MMQNLVPAKPLDNRTAALFGILEAQVRLRINERTFNPHDDLACAYAYVKDYFKSLEPKDDKKKPLQTMPVLKEKDDDQKKAEKESALPEFYL